MADILEDLVPEPPAPSDGKPKKVRYTHDAMIDYIIADPTISQNDLALKFGYSASWVSQIMTSDAFQARLHERTKELVDPTIRATIEDGFKALVNRSIAIIKEKLNKRPDEIPMASVLQTLNIASRAAGYGIDRTPKAPVGVSVEVHLENLGGGLTKLLERKKAEAGITLDHQPNSLEKLVS